nr:telomeric repeat-binding factor 2-interacting protein 1 [Misgurnus anguillicaudatus]
MSKTVKEDVSDVSPVLFLDPSGQPMRFFLRPGDAKKLIHPLLVKAGGHMCRNQEPGAILLLDPKAANTVTTNTGQTYISIQYITDCVEQNQLLDMNGYTVSVVPSVQKSRASRHQGNGRMVYSHEDDAAILKFMEKRRSEAKGNLVWREMEKQHVTAHTWQSMKNRFLKHLQHKSIDKTPEKSSGVASKRKALSFIDSSLSKENVPQTSSKADSPQKSPRKAFVSDVANTQIATENSLCPNPQPSPERASSPPHVAEVAEEPIHSSNDAGQQESCHEIQEQEIIDEEEQTQPQQNSESPETPKRRRLDGECDGQDIPDGSNGHSSSFIEARPSTSQTSTPMSQKLGILARAAKEFEDSDGIENESEEDEGPSEAPLMKPADTHESSAGPAVVAKEPENQAEDRNDVQQGASPDLCNGSTQKPEDERPGPSGTAVPVTSKAHEFIFESETQEEDLSQPTPAETLPGSLLDIKQHVMNLMRETKKDLVEVTKALLMANGDLVKAQVYLVEGHDSETHGPLWTSQDDEILLQADPYELEQLQTKYGEEDVSMRRIFLRADVH